MDANTKPRILYLLKILEKFTDDEHPLTTNQLIEKLKDEYNIVAHRTTIPKDINILQIYGVDIICEYSTQNKYYIGSRKLGTVELKLLIDAVESSKFITQKKSQELVEKLTQMTSVNQAPALKRNNIISERVKTDNENIYYIVDLINCAINQGKQITFQYEDYVPLKMEKVLRHNGKKYVISPYKLVWNGDFYYIFGYSEEKERVIKFRVDRIAKIPEILKRDAIPMPEDFNMAEFAKSVFSMYDGESIKAELRCTNDMMNVIVDRFGNDLEVTAYDMEAFRVLADISISPTFFGWVFSFAGKIQILGPQNVKEEYQKLLKAAL